MELNSEQTTPEEVSALKDYLAGRFSISPAARDLMMLAEDRVPVDDEWDKGDRITILLHATALHLPLQQDGILNLAEEIRLLPEPDLLRSRKYGWVRCGRNGSLLKTSKENAQARQAKVQISTILN